MSDPGRDPIHDARRLDALRATELLDTPPETPFDRLTGLAARFTDSPVALVSLVDDCRQFFKSQVGLPSPWAERRETPLSHSFCKHIVMDGKPLVVEDARRHPILCHNPAVADLDVVAYLGVPLRMPGGEILGSFCVIDGRPREWTEDDLRVLEELRDCVMSELKLRGEMAVRRQAEANLAASKARLRGIVEASLDGLITIDHLGHVVEFNPSAERIFGLSREAAIGQRLAGLIIPPEMRTAHDLGMRRYLENGEGPVVGRRIEVEALRADGTRFPVELAICAIEVDGLPLFTSSLRDISDRKESEKRLLASERRFRRSFEDAPIGMALVGLDGRWLSVNRSLCEILGYGEDELLSIGFQELTHPADLAADLDLMRRLSCGEITSCRREKRFLHKSGEEVWVIIAGSLIRDHQGRSLHFVCQIVDITPRIRAEAALRLAHDELERRVQERTSELLAANDALRSEIADRQRVEHELSLSNERFRMMTEATPMLVWSTDPHGRCDYLNPTFRAYSGVQESQVLGFGWMDLIHPDDQALAASCWASAMEGRGAYDLDYRLRGADGSYRWFKNRGVPIRDPLGRIVRFLGTCTDIDDHRRVEEKLRASEEQLRLLTEVMPQIVWTATADGICDYFNRRFFHYTGIRDDEIHGFGWSLIIHPEDREKAADSWIEAMETTVPYDVEYRIRAGDGSYRWFKVRAVPILDEAGQVLQWIGTCTDIDDQKRAEAALRQSEAMLESRVRERTAELEAASEALRRSASELEAARDEALASTQAKAAFLANMSHEVRTPMAAVLGYADTLLDPSLPQADRDAALQGIRRNGSHLLQIINDILDLSKIEAGRMELELISYSPWQIALEVASALGARSKDLSVSLTVAATSPLPATALIDPTRLRQVLMNLVSNAIKFSRPGGQVVLRVGCRRPQGDPPLLVLEVEDQGIGMTAEQMAQLFTPFQQADSSMTRRFGGTGLGLSICRRIVEFMDGSITVRSEPDRGSCFTAVIPLKTNDPGVPWVTPGDIASTSLSTCQRDDRSLRHALSGRILLVEDSPDNRRVLLYYLGQMGLEVETAENGRIGVQKALDDRFDVILMDMQMPELDGYGAASALRRAGLPTPIIALTAHAMAGDRDKCLRAGCTGYLTKPIDVLSLYDTLAELLPEQTGHEEDLDASTEAEPGASSGAGDDGLEALVREFVVSLGGKVDRMRQAMLVGEFREIERLAHQLKGVGGMYGYPSLTEVASLIEDATREGQDSELVGELVEEFAALCERIEREAGLHPSRP